MISIDGFMKVVKLLTIFLINLIWVVNLTAQNKIYNPFNEPNKTYIINKIIDLRGQTIRIPSGCSLLFKKTGIIQNGILEGDNTQVTAPKHLIFSKVILKGTFSAERAYSEWFDITDDCILDDNKKIISGTDNLQPFRNLFLFNNVSIKKGCYMLEGSLGCKSHQVINGNNATLKFLTKNFCINIDGLETIPITDVIIKDLTVVGCKQEFNDKTEWWHGINIGYSKNVKVENVICDRCRGDGFYIGTRINKEKDERIPQNITLNGIKATNNHRNGLSITRAIGASINNSIFCNTVGTLPETGIDIEPNKNLVNKDDLNIGEIENVKISKCRFWGNGNEGFLIANQLSKKPSIRIVKNILVTDCVFEDDDITLTGCADCKLERLSLLNSIVRVSGESVIRNLVLSKFTMIETEEGNNKNAIDFVYYKRWPVRSNIELNNISIEGYGGTAINFGSGLPLSESKFDNLTIKGCKITNCGKGVEIGNNTKNLKLMDNKVDGKLMSFFSAGQFSLFVVSLMFLVGGALYYYRLCNRV